MRLRESREYRVLNAEAVQKAFKSRRQDSTTTMTTEEDTGEQKSKQVAGKKRKRGVEEGIPRNETKSGLKIKPGESLAHFRRFVSASQEALSEVADDCAQEGGR